MKQVATRSTLRDSVRKKERKEKEKVAGFREKKGGRKRTSEEGREKAHIRRREGESAHPKKGGRKRTHKTLRDFVSEMEKRLVFLFHRWQKIRSRSALYLFFSIAISWPSLLKGALVRYDGYDGYDGCGCKHGWMLQSLEDPTMFAPTISNPAYSSGGFLGCVCVCV